MKELNTSLILIGPEGRTPKTISEVSGNLSFLYVQDLNFKDTYKLLTNLHSENKLSEADKKDLVYNYLSGNIRET